MISLIFLKYGFSFSAIPIILLTISLFIMSVIDIRTQEIPNYFIIINLAICMIDVAVSPEKNLYSRILGMFVISVPLYIIFMFNENIFGGGDIKLMFSVGCMLGYELSLLSFLFGVIFGGIVASAHLVSKTYKKGDQMAFGGFLGIGIFTALIIGEYIINFYASFLM